MKRTVSLILCLCVLLIAYPSLGEDKPSVSASYACADMPVKVGSVLDFTLTGQNCVQYALMVVRPDSTQVFYNGSAMSVLIDMPGKYAFIAYGSNAMDVNAPGYQRCMSSLIEVVVAGEQGSVPENDPAQEDFTTAKMRYVERFFNEDWSRNPMGDRLWKWLDMSKVDVSARSNSGYLMLEQEYEHLHGWYPYGRGGSPPR